MTLYLLEQPDKTWHVYYKTNEFLVGVIAETPLGVAMNEAAVIAALDDVDAFFREENTN